ncbi:sialate O-acetylesterase [Poseidonocella sedimentorum]|uniref:Sialate O-acetylesterase domain-containing protein n=1 Tax=Poseidonocella sedimentorum TaxID=871652 RepID=A0A1I6DVN3_9RHOB|nr:sialate O-acetylesterase [Poseidonocella sedimentorum]SFR09549.1 hypothetical protein SAMN04515673_105256 [Poseidonocella sedimentorum]
MHVGLSICWLQSPNNAPAAPTNALVAPGNLFPPAQASLAEAAHVDGRGNWDTSSGALVPLGVNNNDARVSFPAALEPGKPYALTWTETLGTRGTLKAQLSGNGLVSGRARSGGELHPKLAYFAAADVTAAFPRCSFKPGGGFDATLDDLAIYDLSTTDPAVHACDVVLCLGDSNMSNSVSEFADAATIEHGYDPRIWYMPNLRTSGSFDVLEVSRHVPTPLIEPVASVQGLRVSPIQAVASRLVARAAQRGRPLLMLALAEPGTGFNNTEDWRKTSSVDTTGGRMYADMIDMVAALNALGPAHEIVGAVVSLGANDTTGADYADAWLPHAAQFVTDLRADLGAPNLPIAWNGCAEDYEDTSFSPADRVARMRAAQAELDEASGSAFAIPGVRFVAAPMGNLLDGDTEQPHFTAHGMQVNGRALGDGLLSLLP